MCFGFELFKRYQRDPEPPPPLSLQDSVCEDGTRWTGPWLQPWRLNLLRRAARMHLASVGVSKFCFLFSLAFCGLLLLLIPALRPPAPQVDLPQPRPQVRPAQTGSSHRTGFPTASVCAREAGPNGSSAGPRGSVDGGRSRHGVQRTTESRRPPSSRCRDLLDLNDVFIAVKTTRKYHKSRLELLIHTWVSKAKRQVRRGCWWGGSSWLHSWYRLVLFDPVFLSERSLF